MGRFTRVFVVGPMGAGKTSVGLELSTLLGFKFFDTDLLLEQKHKLSIVDIFKNFGAAYFRAQESVLLENISNQSNTVIATGGGSILCAKNRLILQQRGIVSYLTVNNNEQLRRLAAVSNRPLLPDNLEQRAVYLANNILERHKMYEEVADFVIDTTHDNIRSLAQKLKILVQDKICI